MTFNYARLRDRVAEPQLAKFGRAATLTQPGTPTGDEWNPTTGTATTLAVTVLQTDFTYAERQGTLVQENDVMYLMSTDGDPVPTLADTLTVDSIPMQIIKIKPVSPGAVVVLWRVHCRK